MSSLLKYNETLLTILVIHLVPFLQWRDRYRLAQVNRKVRSIVICRRSEQEAFERIASVYYCFNEVFELARPKGMKARRRPNAYWNVDSGPILEPDTGLLDIRTWLGAVVRTDLTYAKNVYIPAKLPVGNEEWPLEQDEVLSDLVKKIQYLCPSFIMGRCDPITDSYLGYIARYKYPSKASYNLLNILDLSSGAIQKLAHTVVGGKEDLWSESPSQWLDRQGWRIIWVDRPGELPIIDLSSFLRPDKFYSWLLSSPFYKNFMNESSLMEKYVYQCPHPSPYIFTRWITGVDLGVSRDSELRAWTYERETWKRSEGLWMWSHIHQLLDSSSKPPQFPKQAHKDGNMQRWLFKAKMEEIEKHLAQVFEPFTPEAVKELLKACTSRGYTIPEFGDAKGSRGAYLELTLTDSDRGPNPAVALECIGDICVLYMGAAGAVIYHYHDTEFHQVDTEVDTAFSS